MRRSSRSRRIGSEASSPMALTARRAVCGRCFLVRASATACAMPSTSSRGNSWRSRRRSARPCARSSTPCSTERASARACACLRWANGCATLRTTSPPRLGQPMASGCGAGCRTRRRAGMRCLQTRRCRHQHPAGSGPQRHRAETVRDERLPSPQREPTGVSPGLAHLYNLVPYQRRAQHAGQCGVEVEGGTVPTRDSFLNLQFSPLEAFDEQ